MSTRDSFVVHKAIVSSVNNTTGVCLVKIPAVAGSELLPVPPNGLPTSEGIPVLPRVSDVRFVAVDSAGSSLHWVVSAEASTTWLNIDDLWTEVNSLDVSRLVMESDITDLQTDLGTLSSTVSTLSSTVADMPSGLVGFTSGTATSWTNSTATETDLTVTSGTAPSITAALDTNRRYKLVFEGRFTAEAGALTGQVRFIENGTQRSATEFGFSQIVSPITTHHEQILVPASSASVVYKCVGSSPSTGLITAAASSSSPMQFWIEDMGAI